MPLKTQGRPIELISGKLSLPPYGYVNNQWQWDVDTRRVPDGFTIDGSTATPRQWQGFVGNLINELAEFLWPRYDRDSHTWSGNSSEHALDLSVSDLNLMIPLQEKILMAGPVGDKILQRTHKAMFIDEDVSWPGSPVLPTLDSYLPNVSSELLNALKENIRKRLVGLGPAQLRFKEAFQRPRPQQLAFMLNRPFVHEWAKSSLTPAMISGHCFQSLVTRTGAYLVHRLDLETAGVVPAFQQYIVDVGDRRVFAGVHYPSDNISSWYCALRLCDHMYGEAGQVAKNFMVESISRSEVFKMLNQTISENRTSPFNKPMKMLSNEAGRPAKRSDI